MAQRAPHLPAPPLCLLASLRRRKGSMMEKTGEQVRVPGPDKRQTPPPLPPLTTVSDSRSYYAGKCQAQLILLESALHGTGVRILGTPPLLSSIHNCSELPGAPLLPTSTTTEGQTVGSSVTGLGPCHPIPWGEVWARCLLSPLWVSLTTCFRGPSLSQRMPQRWNSPLRPTGLQTSSCGRAH